MTQQGNRFVYYEVKSTNHPKAYEKASRQLTRWAKYWNKQTGKDCYGVYWTPTEMRLMTKNGIRRYNE